MGGATAVALAVAALLGQPGAAGAFEFFDGRIQVHGYTAQQIRGLAADFDFQDDFDLAQWYSVLSLELEADLAPNGLGPLEIVQLFVRAEARYDCVWTHGCGMFPTVNAYGNRAEHLPRRLIDGQNAGYTGRLENGDTRLYSNVDRENFELAYRNQHQNDRRQPLRFSSLPGFVGLFGNGDGANEMFEPIGPWYGDDPPPFIFNRILKRCIFGVRNSRGGENGQVFDILGPWNPSCPIEENGALAYKPNPFSRLDFNPIDAGVDRTPNTGDEPLDFSIGIVPAPPIAPVGRAELPFRPAPFLSNDTTGTSKTEAKGLYVPSAALIRELRSGRLDGIDQNFGQQELAWNHGSSQQDEKELKEAYFDIEAAEGRLWLRIGKQSIVWGKTEIFRNTDQFNPQDFALASLPSLEESRISLWSARGTWSFYNIGKLEDVRLELAVNFDDFEPADLGRCGEPFAFEVVCNITFGYFAHGLAGAGLAGQDKAPAPWNDLSGLELGGRLEWRYKRFSFQLSDFYGYDDFPYPRRISTYERNVDPWTGRPRRAGARGRCIDGTQRDCLGTVDAVEFDANGQPLRQYDSDGDGTLDTVVARGESQDWNKGDLIINSAQKRDVLQWHSANQTAFAFGNILCGATGDLVDAALCGLAAFNGHGGPGAPFSTVANGASALYAGSANAARSATAQNFLCSLGGVSNFACGRALGNALVGIHLASGIDDVGVFSDGGIGAFALIGEGLGQRLTPEQEALLGCGPFFSSDCDTDGIDLLNAEASVLIQSWPGFEGTTGNVFDYDTSRPGQPGTVGFRGGPVATRYEDGQLVVLPGARGPGQTGYDPSVDGCTGPAPGICADAEAQIHPFSGEDFRSELATVSWNFLMVIAAGNDHLKDPANPLINEFDPRDPFGLRGGDAPVACGLRKPQLCETVRGLLGGIGARRNAVRVGASNGFGRRDFAWHSGGEIVLDYDKRNILGFAFDFDEDRTKSNWGVEMTWVHDQTFVNNDEWDGISKVDTLNLSVSIDRPTFINFLNPGRTFFFNTQWFIQYIDDYGDNFYANGPLNVLATLTAFTGYFQDRLMFFNTAVYDFNSNSGALLPSVAYRFNESFSATIGINLFFGRQQLREAAINEIRPALNRVGKDAYMDGVENGLTALRDHDEIYMILRYTF